MITEVRRVCFIAFLAALALPRAAEGEAVVDLGGRWRLNAAGSADTIDAAVPGCVHTDLLAAGIIEDPFYRANEDSARWVEILSWEYSRRFSLPAEVLSEDRVDLVFEGLDTHATAYLNGEPVLLAENMFREYRVSCGGFLRAGENELRVIFEPAAVHDRRAGDKAPYEPLTGDRIFSRKAAYHYGWDWAPRMVTCGIWRPVRIEAWSGARITDIANRIDNLDTSAARLEVDIEIEAARDGLIEARAEAFGPDGALKAAGSRSVRAETGIDTVTIPLVIDNPLIWQPRGVGDQHLYEIRGGLFDREGKLAGRDSIVTGIRTVELVTEPDSIGETFYFRVNGEPVFMKGANWVPLDCFLPRARPARYRRALLDAAAANMNMLRVWGGGVYEDDIFYDLCDSLGIMVWQDFMFANAIYPGSKEFLANVREEAACNIRRLRDHPCIALWCGNNEIDEAWRNWGWQAGYSKEQTRRMREAYEALFHELLPGEVARHSPPVPYVPTSPRYGRADPRSLTEGDAHYWGVWHDGEPFEVLGEKVPRFMSEFGFQSLPALRTIERFTLPGDRSPGSAVMRAHQKHPRGNELILEYMERSYRVPEKLEDLAYVSRLLQARGMRLGLDAHRRGMPRCMGTLYWQLNDCWPAASWSSIDYFGEWKALHYEARRAFDDPVLSTAESEGSVEVWTFSEGKSAAPARLFVRIVDLDGTGLWKMSGDIALEPGARRVFSLPGESLAGVADTTRSVLVAELLVEGGERRRAIHYFAEPKHLDLEPVRVEVAHGDPGPPQEVVLTADGFAFGVELSLEGAEGRFTDNYFDMLPGDTVRVGIISDALPAGARGAVRVRTLADTYSKTGEDLR